MKEKTSSAIDIRGFLSVAENSKDIIAQFDRKLRHLYVNDAVVRVTGLKREEMIGKTNEELGMPMENCTKWRELLDGVFNTGIPCSHSFTFQRPGSDEPVGYFEARLFPSYGSNGSVETVFAITSDETERRAAQVASRNASAEVEKGREALRQTEATLKSLCEAAPFCMGIVELLEQDILHVYDNPSTCQFFDVPIDSTIGKRASTLGASPETIGVWRTKYELSRSVGEPVRFEFEFQKGNERRWLWVTVSPVNHGSGSRFCYVAEDITGRKTYEAELTRQTDGLREANRNLDEFTQVVSHDLKAPLRKISVYSDLLQRFLQSDEIQKAREVVLKLQQSASSMAEFISSLISFARSTSNAADFEVADMNVILNRALEALSTQLEESRAVIKKDVLPFADVRPLQIQQVFQNLIGNAIKYSKGPPRIRISFESKDNFLVFMVKDDGVGLDIEHLDRIFDIFERVPGMSVDGDGIGLSICKRIVINHGGKIWVKSVKGKGSTFYFSLPCIS